MFSGAPTLFCLSRTLVKCAARFFCLGLLLRLIRPWA
jgi:hypothetical protein